MKKNGILILLLLATVSMYAQQMQPTISFLKMENDFGDINEDNGPVTHAFEFTNTGSQPLIISNVNASCGCTTPSWSKTPVLPGEKGYIEAVYDPKNRPGIFNKTITVYSNAGVPEVVLHIKGNVSPKKATVEDEFPVLMDNIRLKSSNIGFTSILSTQKNMNAVEIVNISPNTLNLSFAEVPAHITMRAVPATLGPNEKGQITVTYDAAKKQDWDYVIDRVMVVMDGNKDYKNMLTISAIIQEDFSAVDKQTAPKIEFEKSTVDFGNITEGSHTEQSFIFTNTGKSPLIIRKTKASCGCTAINSSKMTIQPGESSELKVDFDSAGKPGRQSKTITVITNDPVNPKTILWLQGMVN